MIKIKGRFRLSSASPLLMAAIQNYTTFYSSPGVDKTTLILANYNEIHFDLKHNILKLVDTVSYMDSIYLKITKDNPFYCWFEEIGKDEVPATVEWTEVGTYEDGYISIELQ